MKWWAVTLIIVVGLTASFFYFRWSSRIQQPQNFSHSVHVKASISCKQCHSDLRSLPISSLCQQCHSGSVMSADVRWIRVYRITPDIIFDHSKHADVSCATCHQQMTSAGSWIHEYRFPMNFCMKCHAERKASNECRTCHLNR
jgi:ribosomal protein L40E